jgi:hypothetical protein
MVKKHGWCTAAALAGLLGAMAGPGSAAKPPDLPVDQIHRCPEGRDGPGSIELIDAIRLALEIGAGQGETPITVDAILPVLVPPLLTEVFQPQPANPTQPANRYQEARHIFEIGERCRRQGDLDKARTCYEEAHLLSPTSHYGRLAMQRLHEMEQSQRGSSEEQEEPPLRTPTTEEPPLQERPPSPEQSSLKLRQSAQPLGLVERSY